MLVGHDDLAVLDGDVDERLGVVAGLGELVLAVVLFDDTAPSQMSAPISSWAPVRAVSVPPVESTRPLS